jgi:hypothetical protein
MKHRPKSASAAALSLFLLLAGAAGAEAPAPPDTPEGRRMAALIAAFDTGYSIVVLSNDDPPSAEAVAKKIRQWLGLK